MPKREPQPLTSLILKRGGDVRERDADNRPRKQQKPGVNTSSLHPKSILRKAAENLAAMRHALLKTENFHFALSVPLWYMLSSKRPSIKTMFA
jgi:hypothetical protein